MKVLITGANGFIGQHLSRHLLALGHDLTLVTRSRNTDPAKADPSTRTIVLDDISDMTSFHLNEIEVVIHLAGVAHDYKVKKSEYQRVNVEGTRNLARCCLESSVKKLVFLSSVKAIADNSLAPLRINTHPGPQDEYGRSKLAAEKILLELSTSASSDPRGSIPQRSTPHRERIEALIVRIPLVYGEGVKGNFRSLVKLVRSGIPLMFLSIRNKRSYLCIQNLCDFLAHCVQRDILAGNEAEGDKARQKSPVSSIVHLADGPSVSLPELIEGIANATGKASRNYWIPKRLLLLLGSILLGRRRASSLFGDLELHTDETFQHFNWTPPYSLQRGLDIMLQSQGGSTDEPWYGNLSRKPD